MEKGTQVGQVAEHAHKMGVFKWIGLLGIHFFFLFLFGIINFTSAIMATIARNKAKDAKVDAAIKKLQQLVKMYWILVGVYFAGFFFILFFGWALGPAIFIVEYILILIELGQLAVFGIGSVYAFTAMAEIADSASFKQGDGAAKTAHKQARNIGSLSIAMFVLTSFYLVYVFYDLHKAGGIKGRAKMQAQVVGKALEVAFPEEAAAVAAGQAVQAAVAPKPAPVQAQPAPVQAQPAPVQAQPAPVQAQPAARVAGQALQQGQYIAAGSQLAQQLFGPKK